MPPMPLTLELTIPNQVLCRHWKSARQEEEVKVAHQVAQGKRASHVCLQWAAWVKPLASPCWHVVRG